MHSKTIQSAEFLSLPVCGELVSASMFEGDEISLEGASIRAITSILSSVCEAKAFTGVNNAIRNTEINIKHKQLFSFIFFISDKNVKSIIMINCAQTMNCGML